MNWWICFHSLFVHFYSETEADTNFGHCGVIQWIDDGEYYHLPCESIPRIRRGRVLVSFVDFGNRSEVSQMKCSWFPWISPRELQRSAFGNSVKHARAHEITALLRVKLGTKDGNEVYALCSSHWFSLWRLFITTRPKKNLKCVYVESW